MSSDNDRIVERLDELIRATRGTTSNTSAILVILCCLFLLTMCSKW
jgi:hypothetical protein